jgi:hypothetical protein
MRKRSVEDEKPDGASEIIAVFDDFKNVHVDPDSRWPISMRCNKIISYLNPLGGEPIHKNNFKRIITPSGIVSAVKDSSTQKIYLPDGGLINLQNGEVTHPVSGVYRSTIDEILLMLLNRC